MPSLPTGSAARGAAALDEEVVLLLHSAHRPRSSIDERAAADAQRARTDTLLDALRSPGRRRLAALASLARILVAVAVAWSGSTVWTLVALVPAVGGVWLVRRLVRSMADLPDELVGERVLTVRNERYVEAYRILSAVTIVVLLAWSEREV